MSFGEANEIKYKMDSLLMSRHIYWSAALTNVHLLAASLCPFFYFRDLYLMESQQNDIETYFYNYC